MITLNSVNKRSYERLKGVRDIETRKQKAQIDAIIQNWVYSFISWEATLAFLPTLVTRQTPRAHDGPPPMDACQPPVQLDNVVYPSDDREKYILFGSNKVADRRSE